MLRGSVSRTIIRSGIDGPAVLDVNPGSLTDDSQSFTGSHGYGIRSGSLVSPGVDVVEASVPNSAPLNINGDFEACFRAMTLNPGASQHLASKWGNAAWRVVYTGGQVSMAWVDAGGNFRSANVSKPLTANVWQWIRVTLDVDDGAGGHVFSVYTAPDQMTEPTSWTLAGTSSAGSFTTSIRTNSDLVRIGSRTSTDNWVGSISRAIVKNGISGTTVLDIDFAGRADETTSFICSTGQTVTITGATNPTVTINGCARPTVTINSANAVDTNDPLLLPWSGENYVYVNSGSTVGVNSIYRLLLAFLSLT